MKVASGLDSGLMRRLEPPRAPGTTLSLQFHHQFNHRKATSEPKNTVRAGLCCPQNFRQKEASVSWDFISLYQTLSLSSASYFWVLRKKCTLIFVPLHYDCRTCKQNQHSNQIS